MFLKDISVENLKCHDELFLSFEPNVDRKKIRKSTFVLGENGTGKSALLKAIALVTAGSSCMTDMIGASDDWIKNGKTFCEISATLTTAEGEDRKIKLRIDRGSSIKEIVERNAESLELIDKAIGHADRNYFVVGYGASRRLNRDSGFFRAPEFSSPRSQNVHSLFNPDAQLASLTNWAIDLDYSGEGEGLTTVRKALDAFLVSNVKFHSIDKVRKQLLFKTLDGIVPLNQLSDGYQNVVSWVGDLMYRITETFRDFKEPSKARGLLLVDEIDLHLHPIWQRHLYSFLKRKLPNLQVVATTHSPLTVQQAYEHELYALRRDGKSVDLIPFAGDPNKMLLHQILMSPIFGVQSDESLKVATAKAAIREASLKDRPTKRDKEVIRQNAKLLESTPMTLRANSLIGDEDLKLLKQINSELKPD